MSATSLPMIAAMDKATSAKVLEADFQAAVVAWAKQNGWLVHYEHRSGHLAHGTKQWLGSGPKGMPDLVFAKANRNPFFAELKRDGTYLAPDQKDWQAALGPAYHRLWRPKDAREIMDELSMTYTGGK